ncbi:hypothetical protein BDZ89DRAFT_1165043 [Hymenopellis radicata]|nr:hypothetical protein BDZ89DRAFT_1165043 [Hymenopellis radicata]
MLPSPASSSNGLANTHTPSHVLPQVPKPLEAKGHLEPHVSNLPRRRRLTQLPTPDSDTSDDVPDSQSTVSSSSSPRPNNALSSQRLSSKPSGSLSASSSASSSSSLYPHPMFSTPPPHLHHHHARTRSSKGHLEPHVSNIPRRRRPVEVIVGSGVYALPPSVHSALEEDDSGIPTPGLEGESLATVLGRALYQLCIKEAWRPRLVEATSYKVHDLGMVSAVWMGALRREGLMMVEQEVRRRLLGEHAPEGQNVKTTS